MDPIQFKLHPSQPKPHLSTTDTTKPKPNIMPYHHCSNIPSAIISTKPLIHPTLPSLHYIHTTSTSHTKSLPYQIPTLTTNNYPTTHNHLGPGHNYNGLNLVAHQTNNLPINPTHLIHTTLKTSLPNPSARG
jgi:hypothetical protein